MLTSGTSEHVCVCTVVYLSVCACVTVGCGIVCVIFLADSLKSVYLYSCNLIISFPCMLRNAVGGPELMVLSCDNTYIVLQTIGAVVTIRQAK